MLALLAFSATGLAVGGCSGEATPTGKDGKPLTAAAQKKLAEEKGKGPFTIQPLTPLLSESLIDAESGEPLSLAKPGHWTAAVQPITSNQADFEGRTRIAAVDERGQPLPLAHTPFVLTVTRPAGLSKGRTKRVESELLLPTGVETLRIDTELIDGTTGAIARPRRQPPWTAMPSHQYFILVLAREPARYAFLKVADSIRAPYEDENGEGAPHYRVVLADGNKPLPLPPNALAWTSVAYVVWDEVNLDRIDPAQQRALVDWIHWGGRLIINGPDSLDALRGSFLAEYLPADPGESRTITADDVASLNETWGHPAGGKALAPIALTRPWSAIELKPRPGAAELTGSDGLFYERGVGAGSVVVSAMQLAERDLINWPAFDGFLNGALLRRPARAFRVVNDGTWTALQTDWAEFAGRAHDAYFTTPLRWFARDAGTAANNRVVSPPVASPSALTPPTSPFGNPTAGIAVPDAKLVVDRLGGLGGWSEFGPVSTAARQVLREAAGVRVPDSGFVVICLAIYLLVLVPLNWMVFSALGRVEWAWIAAPIVALLGTILVVKLAQLDIGFVRSQTEIALLELHGDYSRGHLSRYTALYSSLSTTFNMEFDETTAVATPFPPEAGADLQVSDDRREVTFESYDKPRLRGVPISSASTQFVHSEEMSPLAGTLRLGSPSNNASLKQLENHSGLSLADAVVVRRRFDEAGHATLDGCWLGQVRDGESVLLPWSALPALKQGELPFVHQRQQAAEADDRKRLNIDPLLRLAFEFPDDSDPLHRRRDEYRLVARIDEALPGATANPAASQSTGATVVLAHLELGPAPQPNPDLNTADDVAPDRTSDPYDDEPTTELPNQN